MNLIEFIELYVAANEETRNKVEQLLNSEKTESDSLKSQN